MQSSLPPQFLGRYAVVRRLGAGGMAEVFLARSRGAEGIEKLLVVKRILPAFAENPHFRAMFIDEARVALRLNHPNVVQVFGFESDGPTLLLIMEHVDGVDAGHLVGALGRAGEKLPPPLAAYLTREVARGLHYAHERTDEHGNPLEIVHRDVSPSNVLLAFDGTVRIGDFGIARVRSASLEDHGAIKGKFGYMSPEQARGEAVDRRADVFALGVVLVELLTGHGFFHNVAQGPDILLRLRQGDLPSVATLLADFPEELRAIADKATQPQRESRYQSAREYGRALSQWLHALPEPPDAATLEHCLARVVPARKPSLPPQGSLSHGGEHEGGATVPAGSRDLLATWGEDARPARPENPALLRERVPVAVIAGRLVPPTTSEHTVDTRALLGLLDALAFKADALLERHADDAFTVVVGVLRPRVDDPLRAARFALDALDAVRTLAPDHAPGASPDLTATTRLALGLSRGVAACAREPGGTLQSYEIVDDARAVASTLGQTARPQEALVALGFYRTARRAFVLREHAGRSAAGQRAFLLERMKTRAERDREADVQAWALTGRDAPMAQLRETLQQVLDSGAGRSILVTGPLGVGKSAFIAAFMAGLAVDVLRPVTALRVDSAFGTHAAPYALVGALLRALVGAPDALGGVLERVLELASERTHTSVLSRRVALRAMRLSVGLEREEPGAEASTLRELGVILRRLITAQASEKPVVCVIDAIEQADRQSRALLCDLARRPPVARLLLVLVARDEDPLVRELVRLPAITLGALDLDARRRLIASAFSAEDASPELVREVSAIAGGSPLMLLEVVEALAERERVVVRDHAGRSVAELSPSREGEAPLPTSLEELLAARLEALSADARLYLRWCSILGAEGIDPDIVDPLCGEEGPRLRARLITDGLLVHGPLSPTGGMTLTFAHPAVARVALASIDPTAIPAMHARVADCLERLPTARGLGAAGLARHREAAGAARPASRAWIEAALALRSQSQDREALAAYSRVLHLTRGEVQGEGAVLRFAAHLGREDIARLWGWPRARRLELETMRGLAVQSHDVRLVAQALVRQARYKLETSQGDGLERDVSASARAARKAFDARTEAEALRVFALWLGLRGRYRESLEACDEALEALAHRAALVPPPGGSTDDGVRSARTLRIEVLVAKGSLQRAGGDPDGAVKVLAEAFGLASQQGPRRLLGAALAELGVASLARGEATDAASLLLASISIDRELGQRERLGVSLAHLGQVYAELGDTTRALACLRRAARALEGRNNPAALMAAVETYTVLGELQLDAGDVEGAASEVERARVRAGMSGARVSLIWVSMGDAMVHLARRQWRLARAVAEGADRMAREAGHGVLALNARALAAVAAVQLGDRVGARRSVEEVLSDPAFAEPRRIQRRDRVLRALTRALVGLGEPDRAAHLGKLLTAMASRNDGTGSAGRGDTEVSGA
ncbi:MAG: protein kinase [Deltaproteobacteria bacterium]|nr:protein kinase [Deltaproteobacteria bacterium]